MSIASTSHQQALEQPSLQEGGAAVKGRLWGGRALSALAVLFLLFDAALKFAMPQLVVDTFTRLGLPVSLGPSIGALLLVSTVLYAIPRTAVLGAVLLTGYLGGAVAIQMRAGRTTFETVFPVLFGVIVWAGVFLRECGLRKVFPVRRHCGS